MSIIAAFLPCALLLVFAGQPHPAPGARPGSTEPTAPSAAAEDPEAALARLERRRLTMPEDRALFDEAARTAWAFVSARASSQTGLMSPIGNYHYATIWDVASTLAALYSARELGLIEDGDYHTRMTRVLATLRRMPLHDNAAFARSYDTRTAAAVGGRGWSATDLGRLFIWLRIVGTDRRYAEAAEAIVRRHDFSRLVKSGYLWGEAVTAQGAPDRYQEGRIGYEQYAAQGFALWGVRAEKALSLRENALPVSVMGYPLIADVRRSDRLMNEPYFLLGLEVGWDSDTRNIVRSLLLAQEARYRKTGFVTMMGEDAIDQPPHYFYYYCVYADGKEFAIDVQDQTTVDTPRWVSTKSAFAFHALLPTSYTDLAVRTVATARHPGGWASGVFEGTHTSTGAQSINLNTAAVILTAAVVHRTGEPILARTRRSPAE